MESVKVASSRSRRSFLIAAVSLPLWAGLMSGCSLTRGHKSDLPAAPVDDYGLRKATKQLIVKIDNLEFLRDDRKENPDCAICFIGVTNSDGEQVPEINEAVRRQFKESTSYVLIDEEAINAAAKKAGIKKNDVFIPDERKKFTEELDRPFRYLLTGQIVSVPIETAEPGKPIGDQVVFNLVGSKDEDHTIVQDRLAAFYNEDSRKRAEKKLF